MIFLKSTSSESPSMYMGQVSFHLLDFLIHYFSNKYQLRTNARAMNVPTNNRADKAGKQQKMTLDADVLSSSEFCMLHSR